MMAAGEFDIRRGSVSGLGAGAHIAVKASGIQAACRCRELRSPGANGAVGREPWSNLAKPGPGSFVFWMLPRAASSISKPGPIP
jgi:hypothetical protein